MKKKDKKKKDEARVVEETKTENQAATENSNIVKNPIYSYKFWVKIFACVLLVILGLLLLLKDDAAQSIVLMFTGGVFCVYALFRVVPLIRTLEKGASRALNIVEIIFDFVVGVFLIFLSVKSFGDVEGGVIGWSCEHYNILIGAVLWLRGFIYFVSTILFHEKTDKVQCFVHILVISVGAFLFGVKIKAESIALGLAILSLLCAVVVGGEGFLDYNRYRSKYKPKAKKPEKEKETTPEKEAPTADKEKEVPTDVPNPEAIIDPNQDDRPYVS